MITFETAKLAKEKGFNNITTHAYNLKGELGNYYDVVGELPFDDDLTDNIDYDRLRFAAPNQSVLQKWLREKHNFHIEISLGHDENEIWYDFHIYKIEKTLNHDILSASESGLNSYEEALEIGLLEILSKFL